MAIDSAQPKKKKEKKKTHRRLDLVHRVAGRRVLLQGGQAQAQGVVRRRLHGQRGRWGGLCLFVFGCPGIWFFAS
jgi:hypothetical protein